MSYIPFDPTGSRDTGTAGRASESGCAASGTPARRGLARLLVLVGLFFVGGLGAASAAAELRPFDGDTFVRLQAERAGRAFLVSLWSLECPPCRAELALLGELKRTDPEFPLVLIATDPLTQSDEAEAVLAHYRLAAIESWIFADAFAERLRHSIDPAWYGELPRSYFYAADGTVSAHSGVLTAEIIAARLSR